MPGRYIVFLISFIMFGAMFLFIAKDNFQFAVGSGMAVIFGVLAENNDMLRKLNNE